MCIRDRSSTATKPLSEFRIPKKTAAVKKIALQPLLYPNFTALSSVFQTFCIFGCKNAAKTVPGTVRRGAAGHIRRRRTGRCRQAERAGRASVCSRALWAKLLSQPRSESAAQYGVESPISFPAAQETKPAPAHAERNTHMKRRPLRTDAGKRAAAIRPMAAKLRPRRGT